MKEQGNLLLAIVLSLLILLGFQYFFKAPKMEKEVERKKHIEQTESLINKNSDNLEDDITGYLDLENALNKDERIKIDSPKLQGSISLKGLKFDDLTFKNYKETLNDDSKLITLFKPSSTKGGYFSNFGWIKVSSDENFNLPNDQTIWTTNSKKITNNNPAIFSWTNNQGIQFEQEISIDENYMFTIKQKVINNTDANISLSPVGKISRTDTPETLGFFILHEGPIGVVNNVLEEMDYKDLKKNIGPIEYNSKGGWFGITDKYWLATLIPDQNSNVISYYLLLISKLNERSNYLPELLLLELEILKTSDSAEETAFFSALFHEMLSLFTKPFHLETFDFSDESFFAQIADLSDKYSKDTQLRKMNGNRGSKHFLYINRTFFGLYNLMHDLGAKIKVNNYKNYLD